MLTPQQVIDTYYLESRCMLIEIAAMLDRYDAAVARTCSAAPNEAKLELLRSAMTVLADPTSQERATLLLEAFAKA
jgi:hypothetical protein